MRLFSFPPRHLFHPVMTPNRRVTFETFMRAALHDPERGYYARRIRAVGGPRGDFTTVPMHAGDLLARAIAGWAADAMRRTRCRDLIEMGPGEGTLMRGVLRHLPWTLRLRARGHFVESSPVLTARQQAATGRPRATWHADSETAMRACGGRAVIFSNELVDAFPVRVFRKSGGGWDELGVEIDASGRVVRECFFPSSAGLPDSSVFAADHPEGQRVEVHDSYRAWLTGWLPLWRAGEMLTIDYGDTAAALYTRRPHGTLRGYLMHGRVTGPDVYQNIGMQDLTADVNFSDLAAWAAPWCASREPQTFAGFLRERLGRGTGGGDLTDESLAGGAFKVLVQHPVAT